MGNCRRRHVLCNSGIKQLGDVILTFTLRVLDHTQSFRRSRISSVLFGDSSVRPQQYRDDLNPVDSYWIAARQLSERPQLVVAPRGPC